MPTVKLASMPTIRRLPSYLHVVESALKEGKEFISGTIIAEELELEPIQVRKDLAITGIVGKPRIGFPVQELIDAINGFLEWDKTHRAIIVGAGHLGTALMGYSEFKRHGMSILAAFDPDSKKVGSTINGIPVFSLNQMMNKIHELDVEIAALTVPSDQAQVVAELLVKAGIRAIWNFTNVKLKVPSHIVVQKEDLSSGYAMLAVKLARMNKGA